MKLGMTILMAAVVAGIVVPATGATIHMRPTASVEDAAVRLGDVATIQDLPGKEAEKLAEVVVLEKLPAGGATVKAEQVLLALASQGAMGADVTLSGAASCTVLTKGAKAAAPTVIPPAAAPAAIASQTIQTNRRVVAEQTTAAQGSAKTEDKIAKPAAAKAGPTLAAILSDRLVADLEAKPEDVRISFETLSPLLDQPTPAGQRWQFRPLTRTCLGLVQWEAQLLEGTKSLQRLTVQAKVLQRTPVLVAAAAINRGDLLTAASFKQDDTWLDRRMPTLATKAADVIGLEAIRPIASGASLDLRDLKPAEMAGRGETINVYVVSGPLVVKSTARAMESGKLHEAIKVRNDATGETYQAVMIGKRLASVGAAVDAATEKRIKEMP